VYILRQFIVWYISYGGHVMRISTDEGKGRLGETRLFAKYFATSKIWIAEN